MHLLRTTGSGARYGPNVDAMLADMEPGQFNEWVALYNLDPWGDDAVQAARLEAAIINHSAHPPETPVNPADLVPTRANAAKYSPEAMDETVVRTIKTAFGG